ncbi:MAG: UDP-2,3-diacylglucosamine diphosphatase [Xanthomonadales bacterium]|nr:UDP-2,3-diacylglucosamine diphosphatase [Xanthomonadales bacterium]
MLQNGKTFFISDTHLDDKHPEVTSLFLNTLETRVQGADALYLLGDIFEYWIGDDAIGETASEVARICTRLSDQGMRIYFQHGNRDFLLGETYAKHANWELIPDPLEIDLYGRQVLLMHGDSLCTDDSAYQAFRTQVRNPVWQKTFLSHTIAERINMAQQARSESMQHTANADNSIMDVNNNAVINAFREHQSKTLIHGHTHRPAVHDLAIAGKPYKRMVLGDWHQNGWLIEADKNSIELVKIS